MLIKIGRRKFGEAGKHNGARPWLILIKSSSIVSERRMWARCDSSIGFTSINSQMFRSVPFRVPPWQISREHCVPTNDYLSQFVTYLGWETWLRSNSQIYIIFFNFNLVHLQIQRKIHPLKQYILIQFLNV